MTVWRPFNTLQALPRAGKLNEPRLKRLQSVLMFGDDLLRPPGDKVVVAQFGRHLGDLELLLCDLSIETRPLRRKVDDAAKRYATVSPRTTRSRAPGGAASAVSLEPTRARRPCYRSRRARFSPPARSGR